MGGEREETAASGEREKMPPLPASGEKEKMPPP
jgi:hypothetical protein